MTKRKFGKNHSIFNYILVGVIFIFVFSMTASFIVQRGYQVRKSNEVKITKEEKDNKSDSVANNDVADNNSSNNTIATSQNLNDLPDTGMNLSIASLLGVFLIAFVLSEYIISSINKASLYL